MEDGIGLQQGSWPGKGSEFMHAVIMAGGKGTRLSAVLGDIPKPMAEIAGKPLLAYQVENLKDSGIRDIILVVGYKGDVIKNYFKDGRELGVNISYYTEEKPLGTAGALYYLKDTIENDFILLFGDLFINIDFKRFYNFHQKNHADVTLYTHPNSHPYDSDIAVTDGYHAVTGWMGKGEKRTEDYKNQVNAGIYVVNSRVFGLIEEGRKADWEKQIVLQLIPKGRVYAYQCSEYVQDVGTPERLRNVEQDYLHKVCEKRNLKYKQKCIFLDRDGTINQYVVFLTRPEQLLLEEGAAEAIREINKSEYLAIVITNQPVIARGECGFETMDKINNRMHTLLGKEGAYLDAFYFCPHHPHSGYPGEVKELKFDCNCRKPQTGMIDQAVRDYNVDLENSWLIGDSTVDIQTGKNAGIKTLLVHTGEAGQDGKYNVEADEEKDSLSGGIQYILKGCQE